MAPKKSTVDYEAERNQRIEDNKRRMQELGLNEILSNLKRPSRHTPKIARSRINLEEFGIEIRRSSRVAHNPKVDYSEKSIDIGLRGRMSGGKGVVRTRVSEFAKSAAVRIASDIKTSNPSFVKVMLQSHVYRGFWLGLPSDFCSKYLLQGGCITLEDETGNEWDTKYIAGRTGLSGGWRGFAVDHNLVEGDALVYELIGADRMKVHIVRALEAESPGTFEKDSDTRGRKNGSTQLRIRRKAESKLLKETEKRAKTSGSDSEDESQIEDENRADDTSENISDVEKKVVTKEFSRTRKPQILVSQKEEVEAGVGKSRSGKSVARKSFSLKVDAKEKGKETVEPTKDRDEQQSSALKRKPSSIWSIASASKSAGKQAAIRPFQRHFSATWVKAQ